MWQRWSAMRTDGHGCAEVVARIPDHAVPSLTMYALPSHVFRRVYARLEVPTLVTANGRTIGMYTPYLATPAAKDAAQVPALAPAVPREPPRASPTPTHAPEPSARPPVPPARAEAGDDPYTAFRPVPKTGRVHG